MLFAIGIASLRLRVMRNLLWLVFITSLIGCKHPEINKAEIDFYPAVADSVREKFLWPETKRSLFFNLPTLYKGVDSLEIRIRPWDVFDLGTDLFVIKVDNIGWKGYHYNSYTLFHTSLHSPTDSFHVSLSDRHQTGDSVFMVKEFIPICGWKNFSDTLLSFALKNLPTQDSIKKFRPVTGVVDGGGYVLEIASKHSYHLISYFLPEYSSYPECKILIKFIEFLQRQLGKDYDWPANLKSHK